MGMFGGLTQDGLEKTEDRLGGYAPKETDAYESTIKVAYGTTAQSGAKAVTIVAELPDKSEYRETIYVTNKKGENFFLNKDDQTKKVALPGYTTINDICLVTTDKPLEELAEEEKVVNIYDKDAGREIPKSVPVLIELTGKKVILGISKALENKSVKQGDAYVATADTREVNTISKVFHHPSKFTVVEAREGLKEAVFHDSWLQRNKGKTQDKRSIKDGAAPAAGRPSSGPPQSGDTGGERKSLFGS